MVKPTWESVLIIFPQNAPAEGYRTIIILRDIEIVVDRSDRGEAT